MHLIYMIENDHIKARMKFDEGPKKCGGSAQATAGRSFAEPAISPFGANLYSAIDQRRDGSAGFE
jgi:hypothetical protein